MEYMFRKTSELTPGDKAGIRELFRGTFGNEKSEAAFDMQFGQTVKGYAYHGIMADGVRVVGCYTSIPFRYSYFGKECVFALSVDTMIDKDYRGNLGSLKKMAGLVYSAMKEDGVGFVFGITDENITLIRRRLLKWKLVGKLDYHVLPINIGALRKGLRPLNILSGAFASLVNMVAAGSGDAVDSGPRTDKIVKVIDGRFKEYRYRSPIKTATLGEGSFVAYSVRKYGDIRSANIIDVAPLTRKTLGCAVKQIYRDNKDSVDVITYLGKLDFQPVNLFKSPEKFEYITYLMSGLVLDETKVDERVFDINNWVVNSSNFDFM